MNKLSLVLLLISFNSFADWQLQPDRSSVTFVSTKQTHVSEVHEIQRFETTVVDEKQIRIQLDLSSVESGIPIRNERMRDMLFDVTNTKYATLSASLPNPLSAYQATTTLSLSATLTLNNKTAPIIMDVLLIPNENGVTATLLKPVMINAGLFGLTKGIDALRDIAGLSSIGYSVPVSATVSLVKR